MGLWNVTSSKLDSVGRKTTISVTTEDEEVIKELIDGPSKTTKDSKKEGSPKKSNPPKSKPAKKVLSAPKAKKETSKAKDTKVAIPKYKPVKTVKLDPPKKTEVKQLPSPQKEKRLSLSKTKVEGKGTIKHLTRNLNGNQIFLSNSNSMMGTRGNSLKKDYEAYRKKIEFSGLSISQKNKLLDKLYKLYAPILNYDSQWYSPMVSGPARYPQAKMDKIYESMMQANSKFVDWWHSIEPQLKESTKSKSVKLAEAEKQKAAKIKEIREGFDRWYNRAVADIPEYQKNGRSMKYNSNVGLAESYVMEALLKVDTDLYKELFTKLNKIANYSKNSNVYKTYKSVMTGELSSEKLQKQEQEDNKVIFTCSDYEVSNLKIDAGRRIAIKFTFYPKPQLVYALKKRGFTWYFYGKCFICKPERFDLEWAKGIKKQYEKYL